MSREEFMSQVEYLLSDLPEEDTRDAIAYYRDYLEEAGETAEEEMVRFGSPERIAAIIRSDIQGNLEDGGEFTDAGFQDERFREPNFQLVKREDTNESQEGERQPAGDQSSGWQMAGGQSSGWQMSDSQSSSGQSGQYQNDRPNEVAKRRRSNNSIAMIILLIILAVAALPVVLGIGGSLIGVLFGILGALFGITVALIVATAALIIVGIVLIGAGIVYAFTNAISGALVLAAGLIVLGVGLLGLVLSVLFYGKFLPWFFRTCVNGLNILLHGRRSPA